MYLLWRKRFCDPHSPLQVVGRSKVLRWREADLRSLDQQTHGTRRKSGPGFSKDLQHGEVQQGSMRPTILQSATIQQETIQQGAIQQRSIWQGFIQLRTIGPGSIQHITGRWSGQISLESHATDGNGIAPEAPRLATSQLEAPQNSSIAAKRASDRGAGLPSGGLLLARVHGETSIANQTLAVPASGQRAVDVCALPKELSCPEGDRNSLTPGLSPAARQPCLVPSRAVR